MTCDLMLLASLLALGAEQSPGEPAAMAVQVDTLVQRALEQQRIPGLSLAVVQNGQLVLAKGYGLANLEHQVPATPETVYQIQSITKSFTATGIMLLVEDGKLGLDDRLSQHLDGTPESWRDITVRHLLTHTSGLKDFINEPTASLRLEVTEEEVLQVTGPRPLNFPPGEKYAYSNTNYHLLAMLIRQATGQSYGDFLRTRIFDPLGMTNTRVISWSEIIPQRAAGYVLEKDGWRNGQFIAPSILGYGGGGLRSTVLDLVKWDAALDTERVLKRSAWEQMWTPGKLNNGQATTYGFGWDVRQIRGHRCCSHTGGHVTGFSTCISRFVDDRLTIIVLSNGRPAGVAKLAERIARVYLPALAGPDPVPLTDQEPQLAAQLQAIYTQLADGRPDDKLFMADLAQHLASQREPLRQLARTWGPLQKLVLIERREENGQRQYRYLATCADGRRAVLVSLTPQGVIAGLWLEEE